MGAAKNKVSMEALNAYVRRDGKEFLEQPNVTSIGVGYKTVAGRPTREISIQFTVGRKVAPEGLESLGEPELPKAVMVDGVEVPTDVIERRYQTGAKAVVAQARPQAAAPRKTAVDPVVPGVSVGNPTISAGTIGCVVYDAASGTPYILSNWHVLHGPKGSIGDDIVQPGRHDDDRVDRNVIGKLVRSHLGPAGDCAIASVSGRRVDPTILDLGVAVRRIGEPELGDHVVKSGRTTDVTFGIVNRVHVTAKIDYDEAGEQEIHCFEIGPDPRRKALNDEISMGGDSGAGWLRFSRKATDLLVGLHFAGEVGDEPEHALACYAAAVFQELEVLPEAPAQQP